MLLAKTFAPEVYQLELNMEYNVYQKPKLILSMHPAYFGSVSAHPSLCTTKLVYGGGSHLAQKAGIHFP